MGVYDYQTHVSYSGEVYRVVEILSDKLLLVVLEEDWIKGKFPLNTMIIPNK